MPGLDQHCLICCISAPCVTCFQNAKKGEEELMIGQGKSSDKCHDISLGVKNMSVFFMIVPRDWNLIP